MGDEVLGHPGTTPQPTVDLASGADSEREPLVARLAKFFRVAAETSWDGGDFAGDEIQEHAVRLGLMIETVYDPAIHGASDYVEPGDLWLVIAPDVKAALLIDPGTGARSTDGRIVVPGRPKTPPQVERREP